MFCTKCGKKIKDNEVFCTNCGKKIKDNEFFSTNCDVNNKPFGVVSTSNKNNFNSILQLVKKFWQKNYSFIKKNKKKILLTIGIIFIGTIFYLMFYNFFYSNKLSWNDEYLDYKLDYVTQTKVKLGVNFSNPKEINKIKFTSNCGKVNSNGLEVIWDLSDASGTCKINAKYKMKKITKKFKIIKFNNSDSNLALEYKINMDSEEDLDFDGLTNKQEKQYKTNAQLYDTDLDGLNDYYEINTSKTNPLNKDSDNDGLSDYDEIELKLNPLKAISNDDGKKDGDRLLTYNRVIDDLDISITGTGNIASTIVEVNSNTKISNKKGLIDKLYSFYTTGSIKESVIKINYSDDDLDIYGLNEDNLTFYYYNEKENKYEKVDTIIDKENNVLTAILKHFSNYVVGDSSLLKEEQTNQILFILDNSWSMYTNEQYEEITGKKFYGGLFASSELEGFDANGIRFSLTSNLISSLSNKNFQIGLSEFRGDYSNMLSIGSDKDMLKNKLDSMNGNFVTSIEGTDIRNALKNGINEFSKEGDNKYIVLLTDGNDSKLKHYTKKIIEDSISNDVKICSIGFGGGAYNDELSNISNGTGCKFYSSSDVRGLNELFENIGAELNDNLFDINGDTVIDGFLLADSGFVVNRDGFSFPNYGTNLSEGGHCYGMATVAQLYYKKLLPLKMNSIKAGNDTSYAYDFTNTYFENYSNLFDYKLKTDALKYKFDYEIVGENIPSDLLLLDGTKLTYADEYLNEIKNSGIYDILEEKSNLSDDKQIEKWGVNYKTADNIYLNEDKFQTSVVLDNDDKQLFNAIYAGFIRQNIVTNYSSGSNYIIWLRNVFGTESTDYTGGNGFINILKSRLSSKDAPVIFANFNSGLHAINAISLVQDIDNPNYYYIGVYDNNYPGKKRYVDIECNDDICLTVANDFYSSTGEPIRISPSLEYDMKYYSN